MRTLVLGGTRFLSREIARQARDRGHEVVCAARGLAGDPPPDVEFVRVDRSEDGGLAPVEGSFDLVIDVARHPSSVRRAVAELAGRAGHWTFVSSCSVYSDSGEANQVMHEPLAADADEADPENYGPAKVACEQIVGEGALLVRAGLIVGPEDQSDRFTYWVDRLARGGPVLAPGSPDDLVQLVDVRDLAIWTLDSAEKGLSGPYDAISMPFGRGRLLAEIAEGLEVEPELVWAGQEFLVAQKVEPWMGPRSLPMWLPLPEYAGFMTRDTSATLAAGLHIRPVADTARDTLAWQRESGHTVSRSGLTAAEEAELLRMLA
ncbi:MULTISPECIES: NAD-dependent epimerase/dehydratase family protein [Streptosporangium]|uniref:Nucleoside-diphosphate-sugar epimerase n=1 Tax=Streptosporangium brasiliense TaxID=47480 RepID=A0ABT9RFU6_9ACTN|nr:NAD-dependent epimerase/dehydratase family protein [Streptosporangium brasiliense]MDP9868158.1 nucleoside-diphosphate-sugar epimerase [Streptosporangium brasiliense]